MTLLAAVLAFTPGPSRGEGPGVRGLSIPTWWETVTGPSPLPLSPGGERGPTLSVPHAASPPDWSKAAVVPTLTVSLGEAGKGLTAKPTEVRLLWDEAYLYVRFACADDDLYLPVKGRDAELYRGDVAEVFLDPVGDGRQTFEIQGNAAGDLFDQLIAVTAPKVESRPDGRLLDRIVERDFWAVPEWNMDGLRWSGRQSPNGWTIEFAIPARAALRRLGRDRFAPGDALRAHLMRYDYLPGDPRRLLAMNWAPVQYGCPHISPAAMGTLRLLPSEGGRR